MQCWQCGKSVRAEAKLCIYCGARLNSDDAPAHPASYERESERGRRAESRGGGAYAGRTAEERDRADGYGTRRESPWGVSERSRGRDDGRVADEQNNQRHVPGRSDEAVPAKPVARRSGGPRTSHPGGDNRPLNPLDDPRAPRSLRTSPAAPREPDAPRRGFGDEGGRFGYGHGGDAGGEGRRGGYEHHGRYYTQGDLGYDPRYDPESGEYDAVADRSRRDERYTEDGSPRRESYDWRAGGAREERRESGYNGGRDAYDDAPSAEYSAEYPSRYQDAPSAEYSAEYAAQYPSRYNDARDERSSSGYSDELDPRVVYGRDRREYRGGSERGYDESAEWDARAQRRRAAPNSPADDSWNLPAISQAQLAETGWTDEWNAQARQAPGQALVAPGGRGAARNTARGSVKRRRRRGRGLTAVVGGLVALVAVAVVIVGISERGAILSRLPGAAQTNAHPFATYTPGPTPTPVANYKEFSSQHALYVLNYPGQWTAQTSSQPNTGYDYVDTFTQQGPYTAVIVEQAAAFANISDTEIATAEVNGGKQGGRTFTDTPAAVATMSIGGEQWTRREFDVTDVKTSTTLHMAILTCHHVGRGYALVLVATPDAFAKDDATVFKTILNSFRFAP